MRQKSSNCSVTWPIIDATPGNFSHLKSCGLSFDKTTKKADEHALAFVPLRHELSEIKVTKYENASEFFILLFIHSTNISWALLCARHYSSARLKEQIRQTPCSHWVSILGKINSKLTNRWTRYFQIFINAIKIIK